MAVIKTENLTYVYGEGTPFRKTAVDNVNIEINDGEMVGIIGHTGSGKSTLIQHFNGLLQPTSGSVYIDGERLWDNKARLRPIRFKVGLVFQYPEYQLFEESVFKDVCFGPKNQGLIEDEVKARATEALKMVGIDESLYEASPFELSGGQKQRVAIARAIVNEPAMILADEPTGALDTKTSAEIMELFKRLNKEGKTVVIVTHDPKVAEQCSRVIEVSDGKII